MEAFVYPILSNGVYDFLKNTIIFGKEHAIRLGEYKTYQRNVKILTERLDILEKHQNEVITMVESAKQMDKDVYPEVLEWIEKTQNALSSYREKVKSSSQNFSDFVVHPQSMIDVDSLSKSINELIEHCGNFRDRISYDSLYYDKDFMSFETRERALEGVMKALKDPTVKMIGLHGMGGIGKTTLAKEIARQAKKEANLFDKVIMGSAISQTPNYANIQFEIGKDLGVEFGNNETILTKATRLREELGKKVKVLIILDDIWEEIDLFYVGIHFSDNPKGSKILFTSRHQGLYSSAVEFAVHSLDEDESTKLFRKVVGKILDENLDCSRELVKECGGVPIVINTVAAALKDAPSFKWRDFLNELRNSTPENIKGMKSKVFRSIKLSYDFLESEGAKSLLLLCSIFPEDRLISDDELLMYSVGWPSFKNVKTLGDARDKLYTLIDTLRKHCLLLPSDERESHIHHHWVKLHDVIWDVLKSVASERNWFPLSKHAKNGELPKGDLKDGNATLLLNDFTKKLPDKLACPNLVSFIDEFDKLAIPDITSFMDEFNKSACDNLTSFFDEFEKSAGPNHISFIDNKQRLSDCFFAETKMLKVLKLYHVDLRSLPSSFSCLPESLETLCLNNCDLEDTTFLGSFKKLKCLDLSESKFRSLSKKVGQLTHLQLLNLNDCKDLEVIEPDVISSLINLEVLYMSDVKIVWEVEKVSSERRNVSLAELKNLPRLNTLYLKIQNDTYLSKDFISRNIKRYQITVGEHFTYNGLSYSKDFISGKMKRYRIIVGKLDNMFDFMLSRVLMLELRNANLINECGFDKLMKECQTLMLRGCEDVTIDIYVSNAYGFPKLEEFELSNASNIRYLMECNHLVFQNMKKLKLERLPNLQKIYAGELVAGTFSKLKKVKVSECHKLKSLFQVSTIAGQLEEMEVESCYMIENIVFLKNENVTHQKIEFLKLQKLVLKGLHKLIQFCKVEREQNLATLPSLDSSPSTNIFPVFMEEVVSFPILEELELSSHSSVKMIWPDQFQEVSYMQNLKDLTIFFCQELKYLFSSSVARSFIQLRNLKVSGCENMEEIVVIKEGTSNKTISFPKLQHIYLESLRNLKRFIGGKHLAVEREGLMKTSCRNEFEEAKLQPLFNEKVSFPMLEKLHLSLLHSVEMIQADQLEEVSYMQNLDLTIKPCGKLKYVFSCAMERRLVQLRNLEITGCWNMEGILVIKEGGSVMEKLDQLNHHHPMALETLHITNCQKLKMLVMIKTCTSTELVEAKDHTYLTEKVMIPNLEEVSLKWIFMPSSMAFQNLREIQICRCDAMIHLMNSSTARSLVQLELINIVECKEMRQVIVDEEEARENVMGFPKLKALMLRRLPNLKSFNSGNSEIQFPYLENVFVIECPHMENFSFGNVITSKLRKIISKYEFFINMDDNDACIEGVWKGDLKTSIRMIWEENKTESEVEVQDLLDNLELRDKQQFVWKKPKDDDGSWSYA